MKSPVFSLLIPAERGMNPQPPWSAVARVRRFPMAMAFETRFVPAARVAVAAGILAVAAAAAVAAPT